MANIRVKDLPNTSAPAADTDEFIIDSSSAGTRRLNYGELKTAISGDFQAGTSTYKVATLGSDNKLDPAQIPDTLSQGLNFVGVANSAGDLTSTTQGDFYVIQTAFGVYSVGDQAVYDGSAYVRVVDGTKEISEGGTGATTLDAAKTNLEIIDVGTGPSQVPLNQHLGTMAFQDAAGVSAAKLQVESTTGTATTQALTVTDGSSTNFVVQEDGKVGVGTSSPGAKLHLQDTGVDVGMSFDRTDAKKFNVYVDSGGNLITRDQSAGVSRVVVLANGDVHYQTSSAELGLYNDLTHGSISRAFIKCEGRSGTFNYGGDLVVKLRNDDYSISERLRVTNSALVLGSGVGIDFGSVSTSAGDGSGTTVVGTPSSLLSDYERGQFTPSFTATGVTFAHSVQAGWYVKVGDIVHVQIYLLATASGTTSNSVRVTGLPFVASNDNGYQQWGCVPWFSGSSSVALLSSQNQSYLVVWNQNAVTTTAASVVSGNYLVGSLSYRV